MKRYAHALYCDDVRRETSGKLTLVGVYGSDLVVDEPPPVTIPKISVVVIARTLTNDRFDRLHLEVLRDEELLVETDIKPPAKAGAQSGEWMDVRAIVDVRSLHVTDDCVLRVRVSDERTTYKAGGLVLRFRSRSDGPSG